MKKVLIISIMYITLDRNFNTFKLPGFRKFLFLQFHKSADIARHFNDQKFK